MDCAAITSSLQEDDDTITPGEDTMDAGIRIINLNPGQTFKARCIAQKVCILFLYTTKI